MSDVPDRKIVAKCSGCGLGYLTKGTAKEPKCLACGKPILPVEPHPISTGGLRMTDAQILKRMAEIEGWVSFAPDPDEWYRKDSKVELDDETYCYTFSPVDPLTNWSDLGPLIEKYKIGVDWLPSDLNAWDEERGRKWEAEIWDYSDPEKYKWICSAQDESLPHAICLAIIEANGGMGDE